MGQQADVALTILQDIGEAIGAYLSAKTTVNAMLALASYARSGFSESSWRSSGRSGSGC